MDDFKDEIRSYLIPFKKGVSLSTLRRDYYNFMGQNLPFRKFGFVDEMELLRAVPDAVRMVQRGSEVFVHAVGNEETAHLVKLVSKQKSGAGPPKATRHSSPRDTRHHSRTTNNMFNRPIIPPRMRTANSVAKRMIYHHLDLPRCVPQKLKREIQSLLEEYPEGLIIDNLKPAFKHKYGIELNHQDFDYVRIVDFVRSLDSENILKVHETSDSILVFHPQAFNQRTPKKPCPSRVSHTNHKLTKEKNQTISDKTTNSWAAGWNENINVIVYNNLEKVIERFPQGFPLIQLCDRYKKVTGCSLNCKELGYNDVQGLICDLDDIFRVNVQKDGGWLLTDARLPQEPEEPHNEISNLEAEEIPDEIQQNIYDLLLHFSEGILLSEFENLYQMNFDSLIPWKALRYTSLQSMLMVLDFHSPIRFENVGLSDLRVVFMPTGQFEPVLPEDAVILGQIYKAPEIPDEDIFFSVSVSSVETPGKVWLQTVSQEMVRNVELEQLMGDLERFYQSPEADRYKVPDRFLKKTMNCAVLHPENKKWHRGCIVGQPGPTSYEVFYYDYGKVYVVERDLLRLLKSSFAALPAQAFDARLTNVKPLTNFFSAEASRRLHDLCRDKALMAYITSKSYMGTKSVVLCDTSEEDDIYLNDLLVTEGLVQHCKDKPHSINYYPQENFSTASIQNYFPVLPSMSIPPGLGTVDLLSSHGSSLNFIPPLDTQSLTESCPPQPLTNSGPNLIQKLLFGDNHTLHYGVSNTNVYHPPNLSNVSENGEDRTVLTGPELIKRLGDNILARKKLLNLSPKGEQNVPRAAVEPIQFSQMKDSEMLVPLSPVNRPITSPERTGIQYEPSLKEHLQVDDQDDVYQSSKEDDGQQESDIVTPVSCAIENSEYHNNQLRFCKRVEFREASYKAHLINFYGRPCFTSADVSSFIFGVDIIKRILHIQKYPQCHILASKNEYPALFVDLQYSSVLGFTTDDAEADKVVLYVLSDVVKILNYLNHKKEMLIEDIEELDKKFDKDDVYWMSRPDSPDSDKLPDTREALEAKLEEVRDERKSLLQAMLDEENSNPQDSERLLFLNKLFSRLKSKLQRLENQSKTKSAADQAREFLERLRLNQERISTQEETVCSSPSPVDFVTSAPVDVMTVAPVEVVTAAPAVSTVVSPVVSTAVSPAMPVVSTVRNPAMSVVSPVVSSVQTPQLTVQAMPGGYFIKPNQGTYLTQHSASPSPQNFGTSLGVPVMPNHSFRPMLPFNYPQFHPNSFVYQHVNTGYRPTNFANVRLSMNYANHFNWQ